MEIARSTFRRAKSLSSAILTSPTFMMCLKGDAVTGRREHL